MLLAILLLTGAVVGLLIKGAARDRRIASNATQMAYMAQCLLQLNGACDVMGEEAAVGRADIVILKEQERITGAWSEIVNSRITTLEAAVHPIAKVTLLAN